MGKSPSYLTIKRIYTQFMYIFFPREQSKQFVWFYVLSEDFSLYTFKIKLHRSEGSQDKIFLGFRNRLRIQKVFEKLIIDDKTVIAMDERMEEKHPVYLYVNILRWSICFYKYNLLKHLVIPTIFKHYKTLKRANRWYPIKNIEDITLPMAWNRIKTAGMCPWISDDNPKYSGETSRTTNAKWAKIVLFYMVLRHSLRRRNRKIKEQRIKKQMEEQQNSQPE